MKNYNVRVKFLRDDYNGSVFRGAKTAIVQAKTRISALKKAKKHVPQNAVYDGVSFLMRIKT